MKNILFLLAFLSIGAKPYVDITIENEMLFQINVTVENTNNSGDIIFSNTITLPKATKSGTDIKNSTMKVPKFKAKSNTNIKITYDIQGSKIPLYSGVVHKSRKDFVVTKTILANTIKIYDPTKSASILQNLADTIHAKISQKPRDLQGFKEKLGSIIVGKIVEGEIIGTNIVLNKVDVIEPPANEQRGNDIFQQDIVSTASLNVPIFGSLRASMSSGETYEIVWSIKYYNYTNSFTFAKSLETADLITVTAIKRALEADPEANVYFLNDIDVIKQATFSIGKGTKITTQVDVAISTVFTGNGQYAFQHVNSEFVSYTDTVINSTWAKYGNRTNFIAILSDLIEIKNGSIKVDPKTIIDKLKKENLDLIKPKDEK